MSEEKKNATAKEVKEEARELTKEELKKVTGGHVLASGENINIMVFDTEG